MGAHREGFDEGEYVLGLVTTRDPVHDCGANDGAVGDARDFGGGFGGLDAEADTDRERRAGLDAGNLGADRAALTLAEPVILISDCAAKVR